jgi:hypothetical protein
MHLYIISPVILHGVMLNSLIKGRNLFLIYFAYMYPPSDVSWMISTRISVRVPCQDIFPTIKCVGFQADHSYTCSNDLENVEAILPLLLMSTLHDVHLVKYRDNFALYTSPSPSPSLLQSSTTPNQIPSLSVSRPFGVLLVGLLMNVEQLVTWELTRERGEFE